MAKGNVHAHGELYDTKEDHIRVAGDHARAGLICFVKACNAGESNNMKFRFTQPVRDRLFDLLTELMSLSAFGDLEENPTYADYVKWRTANSDPGVKALIKKASRKTPIRGK